MKYKISLCRFPGSGWENADLATWLMQTFHKMKCDERIEAIGSIVLSDTPITMTRNRAVKEALAHGHDYILMVDSDMIPDYLLGQDPNARPFWDTAWQFMMDRRQAEDDYFKSLVCDSNGVSIPGTLESATQARDTRFPPVTIAAPYAGPPPYECVYVFRWADSESDCPDPNMRLQMLERQEVYRYTGIQEVAALPTGLILYDVRVFSHPDNDPPWFDYEYADREHSIKATTEDVFQTRNASFLGMPQYCAWSCWAQHLKWKKVGRPQPLTVDRVHHTLEAAVRRGHKPDERVQFVRRGPLDHATLTDDPWVRAYKAAYQGDR
jgi:hypothetical protein